ncbi:hypothetical protein [Latilactobacillus sakei]|uniref:hypothetical protein n=1 Tax=Latilactobacillus sakei TaxID=1599 RepID=UPI0018E9C135|nr:hypothetical protein [Latilactobacillus sakei]
MSRMIQTKYGYETREQAAADARLEKWLANKKRINQRKRRSDNERRILFEKNK